MGQRKFFILPEDAVGMDLEVCLLPITIGGETVTVLGFAGGSVDSKKADFVSAVNQHVNNRGTFRLLGMIREGDVERPRND